MASKFKRNKSQMESRPIMDFQSLIKEDKWLITSVLVVVILTFVTYRGALDNDFVDWDDYAYVVENDLVRSVTDMDAFKHATKAKTTIVNRDPAPLQTTVGDVFQRIVSLNYHPLTVLTMRWNNNVCPNCYEGISAKPFIKWNLILHILNSILVLLLVYWLSKKNIFASVVVALLFALHPMHVESVVWVSERKDVLYTFFFLAALLSYGKYLDQKHWKWLGLTFVLFILSCLSKAMAVVLPIVMLLMWFWNDNSKTPFESLKKTLHPRTVLHTLPFFGVALLFGLIAVDVQSGGDFYGLFEKGTRTVAINDFDTFSILQRFQFASYGFLEYIIKFFIPKELSTFYPYPEQATYDTSLYFRVAPIVVAIILGLALYSIKFTKSIAVGVGFFVTTVILVLQFVSVGMVIMADRYSYLPYIGLAFMLIMLIQEYMPKNKQKVTYIVVIGLTLLFIPITMRQVETWQNSEVLWTNVIELNRLKNGSLPRNIEQPLSNRGNYYGKKSERAKTQQESNLFVEKAFNDFQMAANLGSERPEVYEGIGNAYGMKGEFAKALENYSIALKFAPKRGSIYFNRGVTYSILKNPEMAIEDYNKALQYTPEIAPQVYTNRGLAYMELGQNEAAITDLKKALQYNPNNEMVEGYLRQLGQ
ncbi:tetratricopeptide repeat protein [Acidiluteibacter ferrifornacis]|uniref:Tetratricopeptide repeat protein n=1 Tax=Acidiluteibacter ferrifornacis TaxID=2692424 RepID=A0A6N9NGB5_9FLAO|nr:tetratricopeptide repeat protein [Acidiluteibacter ferrifornacis]NBG64869.1 tetratricopeptide repeat protein [Acidiluteibacter ferrifornacis]